jgi:hypothetical protein
MFVDKAKLKELMIKETADQKHPKGNYHEFARRLGVNVAQLYRTINSDSIAGPVFLGRLKLFCQKRGLNFDDFIFLERPLHIDNGKEVVK